MERSDVGSAADAGAYRRPRLSARSHTRLHAAVRHRSLAESHRSLQRATLPSSVLATYHNAYAEQMKLAKLFSDLDVPMMVGTDSGQFKNRGQTISQEFDELAKAGISPLKILQMTTLNPAIYLGRTDTMGKVSPGYNADLVILNENPIHDAVALSRIWGVVRDGHFYSEAELSKIQLCTRILNP